MIVTERTRLPSNAPTQAAMVPPKENPTTSTARPVRRFQILHPERLAQESPVDLLGYEIAGDQDNLQIPLSPGGDIRQFDPRHVRHADIGNDHPQVWRVLQQIERLGAARRLDHLVTNIPQELGHDDPDLGVVVHYHQLRAARAPVGGRGSLTMRHAGQRSLPESVRDSFSLRHHPRHVQVGRRLAAVTSTTNCLRPTPMMVQYRDV